MKAYLDNAATTAVDPLVVKAMLPYFASRFGNPSSVHQWGQSAGKALDQAREAIATFFKAETEEIIFTSGATESINLSHKGLIEALIKKYNLKTRPHIITTAIEHKAVLETCRHLQNNNLAEVTYLPVSKTGLIDLETLAKAVTAQTVLISVMYVNNEVGTVEPVKEIGDLVKTIKQERKGSKKLPLFFHTDATQAVQYYDCRADRLGADMLSLTGHKIQAPKGIGALYVKKGTPLQAQIDGGSQENRLRAGTENIPYIVGLAKALELVASRKEETVKGLIKLRDKLIKGVLKIEGAVLTGDPEYRSPHIASFVFKGVEGEALLLFLDEVGIAASSGSACTAGNLKPSHVLLAMGVSAEIAHGSLRLSLGKTTTEAEIDYLLKKLPEIVAQLRRIAPKL